LQENVRQFASCQSRDRTRGGNPVIRVACGQGFPQEVARRKLGGRRDPQSKIEKTGKSSKNLKRNAGGKSSLAKKKKRKKGWGSHGGGYSPMTRGKSGMTSGKENTG